MEHWGSDPKGVETTRRFLLEWLSFLHRYVPFGILESPPQRMNERVPLYKGRSDLESLLSSPGTFLDEVLWTSSIGGLILTLI